MKQLMISVMTCLYLLCVYSSGSYMYVDSFKTSW